MRVNDDYKTVNAAAQLANSSGQSVVQFWRLALQRRKNFKDVFVYGAFECLDEEHATVFAYKMTSETGEAWIVLLNFSRDDTEWTIPDGLGVHGFVESNYGDGPLDVDKARSGKVTLRAWEGRLGRLTTG